MIEWVRKWWFLVSTFIIATLWLLLDRRGRQLSDLHERAKLNELGRQLNKLKEDVHNGQKEASQARSDYDDIKRRHSALFAKLGIGPKPPGNPGPGGGA